MIINKKYVIADTYGNMFTGYFDFNNPLFDANIKKTKIYKDKEKALKEMELLNDIYGYELVNVYQINSKLVDIEETKKSIKEINEEKLEEVYKIANNSLYFADSADYKRDLMKILTTLNPKAKDEDFKFRYIE